MSAILGWAAAVVGLVAFLEVCRRGIRAARRAGRLIRNLAKSIESAGHSAQELAELAGAVTNFAVAWTRQLNELAGAVSGHEERLDDFGELLTDALADIGRLTRQLREPRDPHQE